MFRCDFLKRIKMSFRILGGSQLNLAPLLHKLPFLFSAGRGKYCPRGWSKRATSCYKMVYEPKSYREAEKDCSKMKASLAEINSEAEMFHLLYKFG
jgi:hypothetical protein